jgi:hypothetical protein
LPSVFEDLDFFVLASESEVEEVEEEEEMNELSLRLLLPEVELESESEDDEPRRFLEDERFFLRSPMDMSTSLSLSASESLPAVRDLDRRYEESATVNHHD